MISSSIFPFRQTTTAGASSPAVANNSSTSSSKAGKLQQAANASHKVTEYFPIRRSERKPKAEIIKAELETINSFLATSDDTSHGIEVAVIENKGRGIKVTNFEKFFMAC